MLNFTIYTADCVGNSGNCLYPNKMIVTDKESFIKATKMDHVTAKYKGNYRSKDNFESSDCIPLDCDNDHSDNPDDWLTPFDIALSIPGVVFAASYSRHHNIPKGDKSARPRFHIFFPIEIDPPQKVRDAIEHYKESNDWLSYFLSERCELDPAYVAKSSEIYNEYRIFCTQVGEFTRSTTDFYTALESKR